MIIIEWLISLFLSLLGDGIQDFVGAKLANREKRRKRSKKKNKYNFDRLNQVFDLHKNFVLIFK